jgi:16S rRNA (cytidine1402-2'-O)-methyltransferase
VSGQLVLVPTPIGNLEDITLRALQALTSADLILAEDTRTSSKLLKHYNIQTPLRAYHAFNEHQHQEAIVHLLQGGKNVALISDAGTPGISDPGHLLVRTCVQRNIPVSVLPGATALIPALVGSGLPSDSFWFYGFLPHKKGRKSAIAELATWPHTFILYESPHRLIRTLRELAEGCGPERPACVVREISKIHESFERGTLGQLAEMYEQKGKALGEIVLVVGPVEKTKRKVARDD